MIHEWFEVYVKRMLERESLVEEAFQVVDDYNLAGSGIGEELLKPSQLNAFVREASRGKEEALSFIDKQKKRVKGRAAWNIAASGQSILAEDLKKVIEEACGASCVEAENKAAAFARMLRAAYAIRRSGDRISFPPR